jgi:hypothetical protein
VSSRTCPLALHHHRRRAARCHASLSLTTRMRISFNSAVSFHPFSPPQFFILSSLMPKASKKTSSKVTGSITTYHMDGTISASRGTSNGLKLANRHEDTQVRWRTIYQSMYFIFICFPVLIISQTHLYLTGGYCVSYMKGTQTCHGKYLITA